MIIAKITPKIRYKEPSLPTPQDDTTYTLKLYIVGLFVVNLNMLWYELLITVLPLVIALDTVQLCVRGPSLTLPTPAGSEELVVRVPQVRVNVAGVRRRTTA